MINYDKFIDFIEFIMKSPIELNFINYFNVTPSEFYESIEIIAL